jgi:PUA domain protein
VVLGFEFYIFLSQNRVSLLTDGRNVLFFQIDDEMFIPHLKTAHLLPDLLPKVWVDKGAIKFLLQGADVMAPGILTSGAILPNNLSKGQYVAVMAESKSLPLAIGRLIHDSASIPTIGTGKAIDSVHFLNDGLWKSHLY